MGWGRPAYPRPCCSCPFILLPARQHHARQLTQHLDTGLGLDAAGWGAAHAAVPCPIVHLHTVDAQGPVLGDLEPRVLQHKDVRSRPEIKSPCPTKSPWGRLRGKSAKEVSIEESSRRGVGPPIPAAILLTSEMSIWFLYQMTVGFGVPSVRQCK